MNNEIIERDAFVTSGFLPVPACKGGAVETLVQNLIDENEKKSRKKFAVFSIYDKNAEDKSNQYKNTCFYFYKPNILIRIMDLIIFSFLTTIMKKEKKMSYKFIIQRLGYINFVSKKLKKIDFKNVIIENNTTLFLALKWRKNYIKYNNRYFFHLHNDINQMYGCKKIIEECKAIFTVSQYISNIVKEKLNYNSEKIKLLMNCIDMNSFDLNNKKLLDLKNKFNIKNNEKVIVFVGRIIKEKGILEVIKAFNKIKIKNVKLLIVGSSGFDIKIKSDFEREVYLETKKNRNIIFTGFVPYWEIANYYGIADLVVLPSIWDEPAGLTMLEAISSSTPLITTNSGGIPEYVEKFGAIILDKDVNLIDNIKENIEYVIKKEFKLNPKLINDCKKQFNLSVYLKNFITLLEEGEDI